MAKKDNSNYILSKTKESTELCHISRGGVLNYMSFPKLQQ